MDIYVGIDLGTTNSAVACFDGDKVELIPNSRGDFNTPSVVRAIEDGFIVGSRAKKYLYSDPLHTHKEFKRLMGTGATTQCDSFGNSYKPEMLSAEVLKALKNDIIKFRDVDPKVAVVTVPALFELPQSNATAESARLAGFEKVELLPEPVASALAAGWNDEDTKSAWLVFDLGGGTFDVSLVEARDGLLRVVGHDGDNFLGGRDIDRLLVDWAIAKLAEEKVVCIDVNNKDHKAALRQIHLEIEKAKIRLSETEKTSIELDFEVQDQDVQFDLMLSRSQLEEIAAPVVGKAISICIRLLAQHGLTTGQLGRVVLVGGPANMPIVKTEVLDKLAPLAAEKEDPMTLVAKGAALYAATIGLKNQFQGAESKPKTNACELWIQYPTVSSDLMPEIMGRIVDTKGSDPKSIIFRRNDQLWETNALEIDEQGIFQAPLQLLAGKSNLFHTNLYDKNGEKIASNPESIVIVHGLTLSDPPLSRSVGVALADGYRKTFIERGTPLPAKRTFVQYSADTLVPGTQQKLNIPIVQGEREQARFCRKVGNLVIDSNELDRQLPAGSAIEITIEVDRGANLIASAMIVEHKKLIRGVAELLMPSAEPAILRSNHSQLHSRLVQQQREAFARKCEESIRTLEGLSSNLMSVGKDLMSADHDQDACLRAQRNLIEVESELEIFETRDQLEDLLGECQNAYMNAHMVVEQWGNTIEKEMLSGCEERLQKAFKLKRISEIERLIEQLNKINNSAYQRSPSFWQDQFRYAASRVHEAKDLRKANKLVDQGRKIIEKEQLGKLESIVQQLWDLLPANRSAGSETHDSGIH